MNMKIKPDTLFSELFSYYRNMQARRWQYLGVALVLTGLLLNAWEDIAKIGNAWIRAMIILLPIVVTAFLLRLLSRMRPRLNITVYRINELAGEELLDTGEPETYGIRGVTFWLYLTMITLTTPWLLLLFVTKELVFFPTILLFSFSLYFLNWRLPTKPAL